ncbi:MAG: alpha/beta fold hydrolase [Actinomycetota bacterium]|nr:alpha/beta fold hydrolase [Actinomycetota bacterium]
MGEQTRLFCFSFAGGSASSFFTWRGRTEGFQICPIEYPGRATRWRDPPASTLVGLAADITADLAPDLVGSYALFGHSFGATVAFEVARAIVGAKHRPPLTLCISGARAPQLPPREPIHQLPDQEFLVELLRYGGVPEELRENDEMLGIMMPTVREDFRLFEQYEFRPSGPLPVPISVFGGLSDFAVPIGDLLAWQEHTTKSFRCHFYSGGHFFLYDDGVPIVHDIGEDVTGTAPVS